MYYKTGHDWKYWYNVGNMENCELEREHGLNRLSAFTVGGMQIFFIIGYIIWLLHSDGSDTFSLTCTGIGYSVFHIFMGLVRLFDEEYRYDNKFFGGINIFSITLFVLIYPFWYVIDYYKDYTSDY